MFKRLGLAFMFVFFFAACAQASSLSMMTTDFAQGGSSQQMKSIIGSGQVYVGPCKIISVLFKSATAGDLVGVYNTIQTRYPITDLEFELIITANNSNVPYYPNGPFTNGIRVLTTSATSVTTFVFDY